jgi:hypothetical protein
MVISVRKQKERTPHVGPPPSPRGERERVITVSHVTYWPHPYALIHHQRSTQIWWTATSWCHHHRLTRRLDTHLIVGSPNLAPPILTPLLLLTTAPHHERGAGRWGGEVMKDRNGEPERGGVNGSR